MSNVLPGPAPLSCPCRDPGKGKAGSEGPRGEVGGGSSLVTGREVEWGKAVALTITFDPGGTKDHGQQGWPLALDLNRTGLKPQLTLWDIVLPPKQITTINNAKEWVVDRQVGRSEGDPLVSRGKLRGLQKPQVFRTALAAQKKQV